MLSPGLGHCLKAPAESPEAALGETLSPGRRLNGTLRPSCRSPGASSVTGGIFCPFWLKYGKSNSAGGFLQGVCGEDPPAPLQGPRGLCCSCPALPVAPGTAKGSGGQGCQPVGLLEVPKLPGHGDHGDAASLEQELTASMPGMGKSEPAAPGHEGSETRTWRVVLALLSSPSPLQGHGLGREDSSSHRQSQPCPPPALSELPRHRGCSKPEFWPF